MVYESDFYTTRRPYSSRPNVSSYTVTTPVVRILPKTRVYTFRYSTPIVTSPVRFHTLPYVAHKRLVPGTRVVTNPTRVYRSSPVRVIRSSPVRVIRSSPARLPSPIRPLTFSVRPSVIHRELDRIENKFRTSPAYLPTSSYLNSAAHLDFADEARDIRNATTSLLKTCHAKVPRAASLPPVVYSRLDRLQSPAPFDRGFDSYIQDVLNPVRKVQRDINFFSRYAEPARKYVGKSHLASIRIVGNKAYAKRKPLKEDYYPSKVQNDIKLLSYYLTKQKLADADADQDEKKADAKEIDDFSLERKNRMSKKLEEAALLEEAKAAEKKRQAEAARRAEEERLVEEARLAEEARLEEEARLAEEARLEKEARLAEKARLKEEARLAEKARLEEEERLAEEARLEEEARLAEEARLEEEARLAEKARLEEEARLAEKARLEEEERLAEQARIEEEARLEEEARQAEELRKVREEEISRLEELERIAGEEQEAELARQAAELAELARQEAELDAQLSPTEEPEEPVIVTEDDNADELSIEEPPVASPEPEDQTVEPLIEDSGDADDVFGDNPDD